MLKYTKILFMVSLLSLVTGCLYPDQQLAKNQVPYENQLAAVQSAVDQFQKENNGILPIMTKDADTLTYLKYPIDFNKLIPRYIAEPPGNAYESGGIFQYVLINVEKDPQVKLIDLLSVEEIRDLKLRIMIYRDEYGYPPFKERLSEGVYTLDYDKIRLKEPPFVESPFTRKNLSLIIDGQGEIYIDYRPDLYEALQKFDHSYEKGDDIRRILTDNYPFVPAYSVPYTVENNEPIFFVNDDSKK